MKNLTTNRQDFFTAQFLERYNSPTDYSYALKKRITEVMEKPESFQSIDFEEFNLNEIHNYIFHSHIYYKEFWIPEIENMLAQFSTRAKNSLANFRTKRQRAFQIICVFFEKYKTELLDHIALEE